MLDPREREIDRFFESTRGRIVTLLRRTAMTTEELAKALGLTDNAVRAHPLFWSAMVRSSRS
jgi:predicted ArsR family transcriptional regulator